MPGGLLSRFWRTQSDGQYLRGRVLHLKRRVVDVVLVPQQFLEPDPHRPRYLVTEPGLGYRLRVDDGVPTTAAGEG